MFFFTPPEVANTGPGVNRGSGRGAWWCCGYMVQPVRGVWAVVALALCAVVCTSRCLVAQCWHSVCLTKQGRASPGVKHTKNSELP